MDKIQLGHSGVLYSCYRRTRLNVNRQQGRPPHPLLGWLHLQELSSFTNYPLETTTHTLLCSSLTNPDCYILSPTVGISLGIILHPASDEFPAYKMQLSVRLLRAYKTKSATAVTRPANLTRKTHIC